MKITTILPISRISYLDRVLDSLLKQTVKIDNLVVVHDGSDDDFIKVRNRIAELDIENTLCVPSGDGRVAYTIAERRWHIVRIHRQFQELIGDCDWVFSVEDDGILPKNALEELLVGVEAMNNVGMITGVELGRWGIPYVGAWRVDNIEDPEAMNSLESKVGQELVEEIDACGLYCALIRADLYKKHEFDTSNGLGPDVNLGLFCKQEGFNNYINWSLPVTHLTEIYNREIEIPATSEAKIVKLRLSRNGVWTQ